MSSFGNILNGRKVVATAGTPLQIIAANTAIKRVLITALTTNTGVIAIGGSNAVRAAAGSENGLVIKNTSQPIELLQEDLSKVWIDASVNGEGVTYIAEY